MNDEAQDALRAAVREADERLLGPVVVPSYDELLSGLPEIAAGRARSVPRPSFRASWRPAAGWWRRRGSCPGPSAR